MYAIHECDLSHKICIQRLQNKLKKTHRTLMLFCHSPHALEARFETKRRPESQQKQGQDTLEDYGDESVIYVVVKRKIGKRKSFLIFSSVGNCHASTSLYPGS